jgi:flagellar protein FlgJ
MKSTLDSTSLLAASQKAPDTSRSQRDKKALKKTCQDFEAIFIQSLFKSMRKTVPDGGVFKKDNATEIYQDMFDQEISKNISRKQSLGLAEQMYRQIEKKLPSSK